MMKANKYSNDRIVETHNSNALEGMVKWAPLKSFWITFMYAGWMIGGTLYFSYSALLVFLLTCAITLCLGHSLGMHRKLIHNSYECPPLLEYLLVYLGTLVGLGGPFSMSNTHDMRDWAQRQGKCHDYFGHRQQMFKDAFWQMHCDIHLKHPPEFFYESHIKDNAFYRFIERYWMAQQLPWVFIFLACGGPAWVFWGICGRVAVCITGHWLLGYFAHNSGGKHWHVKGASIQGYDVNFCGFITFGECWHNNHHAFPGSAKIGIYKGQSDPGWWVLKILEYFGLVKNLKQPEDLPERPELVAED